MKSFLKYAACMAALTVMMAACSKDDSSTTDGGSTEPGNKPKVALNIPKAGTAARYDVTLATSDIDFVELAPTGNYIVGLRVAPVKANEDVVDVVEGQWASKDNNEYQLAGWGSIALKVNEAGDALLMSVTLEDEEGTEELPVTLTTAKMSDNETRQLARSWELTSIRLKLRIALETFNNEYTQDQLPQMQTDLVQFLNKAIPDNLKDLIGDVSSLINVEDIVYSDRFYHRYTFTTIGSIVADSYYGIKTGTWSWSDSKRQTIAATLPYEETFAADISYRDIQLCVEPKVQEIEDVRSRLGVLAKIGFDFDLYMYYDKAD